MAVNRQRRSSEALHGLRSLLRVQPRNWEGNDRRSRRRSQQRRLLQQLIAADPDALGWLIKPERGHRFWRALRWGGPGLLLGWWLAR